MKFQTSAFIKNVSVPRDFHGGGGGGEVRRSKHTRRSGTHCARRINSRFDFFFDGMYVAEEEGVYVCVCECVWGMFPSYFADGGRIWRCYGAFIISNIVIESVEDFDTFGIYGQ